MRISPDDLIFWEHGFIKINSTIVTTWALMLFLIVVSYLITRNLKSNMKVSKWQAILEMIVLGIQSQIEEVGLKKSKKYLPFIGTLFLFIGLANLLTIIPGYEPPTASISTTIAFAIAVFIAVPIYGISEQGFFGYLKSYVEPTFIMLPFTIISEVSRTLALAVRLFGNMMSGGLILTILLGIAPLIFPIIMTVLGLLTGMVQAYIFGILSTVYIAAATQGDEMNEIL
jgi:F-type H+-transporting ATPase subunit a